MLKDKALLEGYRAGESWAYERLYNEHGESVARFLNGGFSFLSRGRLCRYRGNAPGIDQEAIVQETFARALAPRTRVNYDGERPFRNYLFSIAKNLVLREYSRRERVLDSDQSDEAADVIQLHSSISLHEKSEANPERLASNNELSTMTTAFVRALSEEEQRFFDERFVNGNTQDGTAKIMGCTRARIKLLEKNIRRSFLENLRESGYFVGYEPKARWSRDVA
ncbi:MAG: sigma-70 family RNA polymerase sigma factor [Deltaproteobacteria bacterium]|nr:sigma-70 family RNA polymerase sigma factor [Deltaproteobacteria bacterium]